jgi:rhodanese-related sulfurtransferase
MKSSLLVLTFCCVFFQDARAAEEPPAQVPAATAVPSMFFKDVDVAQFDALRAQKEKVVVLDVRTPEEYAAGHIPGSVLLDFRSPKFAEELAKLSREKQYLVHCAVGGRSAKACDQMTRIGLTNIVNLKGGFKAWQAEGKPIER